MTFDAFFYNKEFVCILFPLVLSKVQLSDIPVKTCLAFAVAFWWNEKYKIALPRDN